jgi:hypothetical protein
VDRVRVRRKLIVDQTLYARIMDGDKDNKPGSAIGAFIAIGAGAGAALFAATGNPVWIGVFAGAGVAIGAAVDAQRRGGPDA